MQRKALISVTLCLFLSTVFAVDRVVPTAYPTIQAAIDAATAGDVVVIQPGNYMGAGNFNIDFQGKAITVRSADGPATCLIDCQQQGRGFVFQSAETPDSVLEGVTILNGQADFGGGIECDNSSPTIQNCVIQNCQAEYGGGIDCYYAAPTITNCVIRGNMGLKERLYENQVVHTGQGGGIECNGSTVQGNVSPIIFNCLIVDNISAQYGSAINVIQSSAPEISFCTIAGNEVEDDLYGGAVRADLTSALTAVNHCILWNNGTHDLLGVMSSYCCVEDGTAGEGNFAQGPRFYTGPLGDYYLSNTTAGQLWTGSSPCIDAGNPGVDLASIGLEEGTTRTDNTFDTAPADLGYHYPGGAEAAAYTLTTEVIGAFPGEITPDGGVYTAYSEVILTASTDIGYKVLQWTGTELDDVMTDTTYVRMTSDRHVTVSFQEVATALLTTEVVGEGTITPATGIQAIGDTIMLTVNPAEGWRVETWEGTDDDELYTNAASTVAYVTMDGERTVRVTLSNATHVTLRCEVLTGHGTITPYRLTVPVGEMVELEAIPDPGYQVKRWTNTDLDIIFQAGDFIIYNTDLFNTVTMNRDKIVTVEFERAQRFWLETEIFSPDGDPHGTLEPASGWFDMDEIVDLIATPDPDYEVEFWLGTDDDTILDPANTITMIDDTRVVVKFKEIVEDPFQEGDITLNGDRGVLYGTIQEAIDAASDGDEVVVSFGTYGGPGNMDLDLGGKAITVRSAFGPEGPLASIIDCGGAGRGFWFRNNESPQSVVRGFTIQNGLATRGGGVYYMADAEAVVEDCIILNCQAEEDGGGVCFGGADIIDPVDPSGDDPNEPGYDPGDPGVANNEGFIPQGRLVNVQIRNCFALGASGGTMIDDAGNGGGIYIEEAAPVIVSCQLQNNQSRQTGGAMYILGIEDQGNHPAIINCLIIFNRAQGFGGSIYMDSSSPTIRLCTIAYNNGALDEDNPRLGRTGGIVAVGEDINPVINHCILHQNGDSLRGCNASYSCITDFDIDSVGQGNVYDDPLFITGPLGDYYLSQAAGNQPQDSPCVDAGQSILTQLQNIYGLSDQITTSVTSTDDVGQTDIGYHLPKYVDVPEVYRFKLHPSELGTVQFRTENNADPGSEIIGEVTPDDEAVVLFLPAWTIVHLRAVGDPGYRLATWQGTDNDQTYSPANQVTMTYNREVWVTFEEIIPQVLVVPSVYSTIEQAMALARDGDVIVVEPGVHYISSPEGIDFELKEVKLISTDPDDPATIAATIIDCQGTDQAPKRAFHFHSGEGNNTLVAGFTIRKGWWNGGVGGLAPRYWWPNDDPPNDIPIFSAYSGGDSIGDGYGGAVLCENASSPTIQYCVIKDCTVTGGQGLNGYMGTVLIDEDNNVHSIPGGHGGTGTGTGCGGAIACLDGSSPILGYISFQNNFARGGCGGDGGNAGDIRDYLGGGLNAGHESRGGNGGDGYGVGNGGAIFCDQASNPVLMECDFISNVATQGLYGTGGNRSPSGTSWGGDWVARDGANGYVYVTNGTISGGAAYYLSNSTAFFENCRFENNKAYEAVETSSWAYRDNPPLEESYLQTYAGAMYIGFGSSADLYNCMFEGNLGGAMYCEGAQGISLQQCDFWANGNRLDVVSTIGIITQPIIPTTGAPAGAIHIDPYCSNILIEDCAFGENFSIGDGGAVTSLSTADFVRCRFGGNRADGNGGALFSQARGFTTPQLTFDHCGFIENEAMNGGAVYLYESSGTFQNCQVYQNMAENGAGLYLAISEVAILDGTIANNTASSYDAQGGGIANIDTMLLMQGTILQGNLVEGQETFGGALSIFASDTLLEQQIENCLFVDNQSSYSGGAVAIQVFCEPTFTNCTFVNNSADQGGALFGDWCSYPVIINSIFTGNTQQAIYEEPIGYEPLPGGNTTVSYSLFHDNEVDLFDAQTEQGYTGADVINTLGENMENLDGDPQFIAGSMGAYYLDFSSPAIDRGNKPAQEAGLDTRTTRIDDIPDSGIVDLGYHYIGASGMPTYTLTVSVVGGHGTVGPINGIYAQGQAIVLTATPDPGYRVDQWGGGTINDRSGSSTNVVIMDSNKHVTVQFEQPRVLVVGSNSPYTDIQRAIDDAEDGDTVMVQPGQYQPAFPFDLITFTGKSIRLSGMNPDNPQSVADTVLIGYDFILVGVGKDSVMEGLTIQTGQMYLMQSDMTIRNCQFVASHWVGEDGDGGDADGASDGENGERVFGGAIIMYASNPKILNCRFENLSVTGGNGGIGSNGDDPDRHGSGWDGGWPGRAYGGAVYIGFSSDPIFMDCVFMDCFAQGGNAGNGGNAVNNDFYGGRGGGWVWAKTFEDEYFSWWDGWQWGDRYRIVPDDTQPPYAPSSASFGGYEWERWSKWFDIKLIYDWDEWNLNYVYDPYDTAYDDYWRYSGYGGAVYCEFDSNPTFMNCHFENNRSYGGLSGIGGEGGQIDLWPDRQLNLETGGGALFATRGCKVTLLDCVIRSCTADPTTIDLSQDGWSADDFYISFGGGIAYTTESKVNAVGCTFEGNQAAVGGAIYWDQSELDVADCNMLTNSAYQGAAMYSSYSMATIRGAYVADNLAMSDPTTIIQPDPIFDPGQLAIPDLPNPVEFGHGGGYFSLATPALIEDSVFEHNRAAGCGGGLYLVGSDQDILQAPTLDNCLIVNNVAGYQGGGLASAWYAEPVIRNSTIADNNVTDPEGLGGGVFVGYHSNGDIENSIIWNNVARHGSQAAVSSGGDYTEMPSSMAIRYSDILYYEDPSQFLPADPTAHAIREGFDTYSLSANNDQSTDLMFIGFPINFFGTVYDSLYVNNNGNVTFDAPMFNFIPDGLTTNIGTSIIAPFFADVDTRGPGSDIVTWSYGAGSVDGRDAFGVNWINVGYFFAHTDKLNSFQLIIIDRSDRNPGDFDLEFNYDTVQWETGDASGGVDGFSGESAHIGYSNGTGLPGTFFEFEGSGVNGYFLDSSSAGLIHGRRNSQVLGRYSFRVLNGQPEFPGTALYVEDGSVLHGWNELGQTWDEGLFNFNQDPLFLAGYYLSQIASGQEEDSPCIDIGSDIAGRFGLTGIYTTRTDGVGEDPDSIVDIGYHYREPAPPMRLILTVIGEDWGDVTYEPITGIYDEKTESYLFPVGTIVKLTATPKPGYRIRRWVGTDDERTYLWHESEAEVTMDQDRVVELEFEADIARILTVPEAYPTIEDALAVASGGDTIVVAPGVHYITAPEGIDFGGRDVRLISTDPDDPQVIAATIIDCQGARYTPKRAFHFHNRETSESLISGLTIQNGFWIGSVGLSGVITLTDPWPSAIPPNADAPNTVMRAAYGEDARGFGYGGAILCEEGSSPTIENCVFKNCTVLGGWAGDGAAGGTWPNQLGGPHSQSGGHGGAAAGNGFGGAIACILNSSPTIRSCSFEGNIAGGSRAGDGGDAGPSGGGHEGCGGDGGDALGFGRGGAVYCDRKSSPLIMDCDFKNNEVFGSVAGLGGLMASGSEWDPYWPAHDGFNGTSNSYERIAGGAIFYGLNSNAQISHCTFEGNKSYDSIEYGLYYQYRQELNQVESYLYTKGGAIYSDPNNSIILQDCDFTGNLGGAVYLTSSCWVDVKDCTFTANGSSTEITQFLPYYNLGLYDSYSLTDPVISTDTPAGALYIGPLCFSVHVEDTRFSKNFTFGDGGAVTCKSDADFVECYFAENEADRFGGGFFAYDSTRDPNDPMAFITLDKSTFMSNRSLHGGAMWLRETRVKAQDTHFFANRAETGGAILAADTDLTLDGGILRDNQATLSDGHGGAILMASATGYLRNLIFENNTALGENAYGGAVSFYGSDSRETQIIENCLLTGNHAGNSGGAIACRIFTEAQVRNCTLVNNTAEQFGGGIFCDWSSYPKISDSILTANVPHAVYEEQIGGNSIVRYSLFYDNVEDLFDANTGLGYNGAAAINALQGNESNTGGDPLFVAGPFGSYYLDPISVAVDAGSNTAENLNLDDRTTRTDGQPDTGTVDIGYHFKDISGLAQYTLTAVVDGGHGAITPISGTYYAGSAVTVTAIPDKGYTVDYWGGGTVNDASLNTTNIVVMNSDKYITVRFKQPRVLLVGSGTNYTTIQHAIQEAEDGDIVLVKPGQYIPAYPFGIINFLGKNITLSGMNPDDSESVASTVLQGYNFYVFNVGEESIIEGITIQGGQMWLVNSYLTIRNCVFENTHVTGANGTDGPDCNNGPRDGYNGSSVYGGSMRMYHSSPKVLNCRFQGLSVTGGDGGRGSNGCDFHPEGWDGGWAGRAYGGAVYMGFGSAPEFLDCEFINCYALGGNGGNGGDHLSPDYGGRGGNWIWPDFIEDSSFTWWDGWEWGDKYDNYLWYGIYRLYDWKRWAHWYDLQDYHSWEDWDSQRQYDPYENAFEEYWRYSGYGGAVYCDFDSSPKFTGCRFEDNHSYGGVSGIGGNGINAPWPNRNLNIENGGGALFATRGSKVEMAACVFRANSADPSTLYDTDPGDQNPGLDTYDDYYVSFGGGVACTEESTVEMTECTFESNQAAIGGGFYWADTTAQIADCNFLANSAYHGAGLYSAHADGSISGLYASFNLAALDPAAWIDPDEDVQTGQGPVILPDLPHAINFGNGGGYFCLASLVDVRDSIFEDNRAAGAGGGIYYAGSDPDVTVSTILHNTRLTRNAAGRDGGGVSADWYSRLRITNSTLAENTVTGTVGAGAGFGGGLYCSYGSDVDLVNSILWGNIAVDGAQVAVGSGDLYGARPSTVRVSHSDIGPAYDPNAVLEVIDGEPTISLPPQSGSTALMIEQETILQQYASGTEQADLIVTLRQPVELRKSMDWNNPFSVQVYRSEVARRIDSALAMLPATEYTLKYRYENIAAFSGSITQSALNQLMANHMVISIEPVRYVRPTLRQAIALANATQARQVYDGTGTAVAIIDSGVDYRHPMLGGGAFPNDKVIGGYDTGDNDADPMPSDEAHGTACAGIAAGTLGEVGDYIGGVAFNAKIYALKITTDTGLWPTNSTLNAWDWCITHQYDDPRNPILVMSNSWGNYVFYEDPAVADAFSPAHTQLATLAVERGITILAASGNEYSAGQGIIWPSAMSDVISVGAVFDTTDQVTPYTNMDELLDILAPGDPMYTTDIVDLGGYDPGDYYPYFGGTSSACPFAAGCVASIQRSAMLQIGRFLTPGEIRTLLINTGVPVTDTKVAITKPRVNLGLAVANLVPVPIFVEEGCELTGWDPIDQSWDPETFNLEMDPLFVGDYFLSEIAAGQLKDSPCLDAGSDMALAFDLDTYTTRSDSVPDDGIVNMGYHHRLFEPETYFLYTNINAYGLDLLYGYEPQITPHDPDGIECLQYTQFELEIVPPPPFGYEVVWSGTDDDTLTGPINVVTVDSNTAVLAEFVKVAFELTTEVTVDPDLLPNFEADMTPPEGLYEPFEVVELNVTPPPAGFQVKWIGTDDDSVVAARNFVTMLADTKVEASYEPVESKYYAIIVGINDYPGVFYDLQWSNRDASQFFQKLVKTDVWDEENMFLLLDSQATKTNIQVAFQTLADEMDYDDVFVFYFSGHGTAATDTFPIDEADELDEFLVDSGGEMIRDDEMADWIRALPTDQYVVFLDTGYYGQTPTGDFIPKGIGVDVPKPGDGFGVDLIPHETILPDGTLFVSDPNGAGVVVTAAGADQVAWEYPELRHSLFTYQLLKAIDGQADQQGDIDLWVSGEESYHYTVEALEAWLNTWNEIGVLPSVVDQQVRMYDAVPTKEVRFVPVVQSDVGAPAVTYYVPGDAKNIQEAVEMAKDGDLIILAANVYDGGGIVIDKAVTITSTNPDDPDIVASTVINCGGFFQRGVYFTGNAGRDAVLNGVTIRDGRWTASGAEAGTFDGRLIGGGGIVVGYQSSPTIKNCVIQGFQLTGGNAIAGSFPDGSDGGFALGAGVLIANEAEPLFVNCTITDCHVIGGNATSGVSADPGDPTADPVVPPVTTAGRGGWGGSARGGGVYISAGAKPIFEACTISGCTATGGNGGNGGNYATIYGVDVPGGHGGLWSSDEYAPWYAWGYTGDYRFYSGLGGGVYCEETSEPTFIECQIIGNSTQGGISGLGGAMPAGLDRMEPKIAYELPTYGGGVYCAAETKATFVKCKIVNNIAPQPTTNYALDPDLGHGGGVAFEQTASVQFEGCLIKGNEASVGGGMYWYEDAPQIADCNFLDNTAYRGGGLYAHRGAGLLTGGLFSGNLAYPLDGSGGGIVDPNTGGVVGPGDASTDILGQGGGICMVASSLQIEHTQVLGNQASTSGGGIFITGSVPSAPVLLNVLLARNKAGRDGGGLSSNWLTDPTLANCTFAENEVLGNVGTLSGYGGGLYCGYDTNVQITDSIFWGNTAPNGRQIQVGTGFEYDPRPSQVSVTYTTIQGREAQGSVMVEEDCVFESQHIMSADPKFVTGPLGDFYLSQIAANDPLDPWPAQTEESPAVDAGSIPASQVGLDIYTTRTDRGFDNNDRGVVDLGFHYPTYRTVDACSYCDIASEGIDGVIRMNDLAILAKEWLHNECSEADNWCNKADINTDGSVDLADYMAFVSCWLVQDELPPVPNPAEWGFRMEEDQVSGQMIRVDGIPTAVVNTTNIIMTAAKSWDDWGWPVAYQFECIQVADKPGNLYPELKHKSDWIYFPDYEDVYPTWPDADAKLQIDLSYKFVVRVGEVLNVAKLGEMNAEVTLDDADIRLITLDSEPKEATAGVENIPPAPVRWADLVLDGVDGLPGLTADPTELHMIAAQAVDAHHGPVEYEFIRYADATTQIPDITFPQQSSNEFTDTGLTTGTTYYYAFKVYDQLDNWAISPRVPGTPMLSEFDPPTPDPAEWDQQPTRVPGLDGQSYDYMRAVQAQDASLPVEYRFIVTDGVSKSSGWQTQQYQAPDDVFGTLPLMEPWEYMVRSGGAFTHNTYVVIYRDSSPSQNMSAPSVEATAGP
ncbi:MAG: right-handed parallel beta-helix repeat-containing protein [Sedimentisphaerales bacterium]|nr:right-handed parallel beta-helix repeat-containing protein [Sedimentisphaerales bacterium]